jgi:hypothetical protein
MFRFITPFRSDFPSSVNSARSELMKVEKLSR